MRFRGPVSGWGGRVDARVIDASLVVLGLGLAALAVKTPWSLWPRPVIAVAGVAGAVTLWWSRRWPVPVTAVGALSFTLSGNPWPLLVGLFRVAAAVPRRGLAIAVAAGVAVAGFAGPAWVDAWLEPGSPGVGWSELVGAVGQVAVVTAIGVYLGTRQELLATLRERAERAEAERLLRDERARADERTRIAREMHDVLAHKVSLIALHAGALEVGAGGDAERITQGAALIRGTAHEALNELRAILGMLRTDSRSCDAGEDRATDLNRLVGAWSRAGVEVTWRDEVGELPVPTARTVHRLVQEGLTNAHKHAPGAAVTASITRHAGGDVVVSVCNGPPSRPDDRDLAGAGAGVGLVGLTERVNLVGGTLRCGSDGRGGWHVHARLPWLATPTGCAGPVGASPVRVTSTVSS
jgi:signal transduction histidine kinase